MINDYKQALVTGGSSGIGLEIVRSLAGRGLSVCVVALPDAELESVRRDLCHEFPDIQFDFLGIDLTDGKAAEQVYYFCQQHSLKVDLLVNNAGFGTYGWVYELSVDREMKMIDLHIKTLYHLTRLFLPEMMEKDRGVVVNISSVSAFQPNPGLSTYGATKAFVYQWTRALQEELKITGRNVKAIVICPTPVRTPFMYTAGMERSKLFESWMAIEAPMVARAVLKAIDRGSEKVIPGVFFNWLQKLVSRLPESWRIKLAMAHLKEK